MQVRSLNTMLWRGRGRSTLRPYKDFAHGKRISEGAQSESERSEPEFKPGPPRG